MLTAALEADGFAVCQAANSQKALCLIDQAKLDLILLNLMTGDADDQALCVRLLDCYDLPIVVMSNSSDALIVLNAFVAGTTAFVQMPFGLQELEAQLKQAALLYRK